MAKPVKKTSKGKKQVWPFRGICLSVPPQKDFEVFKQLISEVLPSYKCNTLVLLVRYNYAFKSHPEVCEKEPLTKEQAVEIAGLCRRNNIRIIPKMNLFGHQSERSESKEFTKDRKLGLLRAYPDIDETGEFETIRYCRSICPRHCMMKDGKIIFDLIDELLEAFDADAFHVGLDEVFEIGRCPRCKDSSNADLFAEWVKVLHGHIAGTRKKEMFMWADRLLDVNKIGALLNDVFSDYEYSGNNTALAIDKIPKDIVLCDWHYGELKKYPSIRLLTGKGFRTIVCPWKDIKATEAFLNYAAKNTNKKLIGFLVTTWCNSGDVARYLCNGDTAVSENAKLASESLKWAMKFDSNIKDAGSI